jgi:hypothetical protein
MKYSKRYFAMSEVLVFALLLLFFLISLRHSFSNYVLSWDDADYLRVTSCFAHSGLNYLSQDFRFCESLIYKSPIFLHLGSLFGIPFHILSMTVPDELNLLIEISLGGLFVLNMFLIGMLFYKFRTRGVQVLFTIASILLFKDSFTLFMTDVTASLLGGLMVVSHLRYRSFNSASTFFWIQFALFIAAIGTRTTCAPLIILVFFAGYNYYRTQPSSFFKALSLSAAIFVIFSLILIVIWKSVLPAAWAMFGGNQSNYFGDWMRVYNINLTLLGFEKYFQILLVILFLLLVTLVLRKWRTLFNKMHFLAILPSFIVAALYAISESKDPRFLMWPLFSIVVILLMNLDINRIDLETIWTSKKKLLISSCLTLLCVISLSIATNNEGEYGLKLAKEVYRSMPIQGSVCPLTDSPELNISKILLVDSLNGNAKSLNSRIVNIPDSAMNGLNVNQVLVKASNCDFSYAQTGIDLGGIKNEFTSQLTKYLTTTKGTTIQDDQYLVIYDKRQSRIALANE